MRDSKACPTMARRAAYIADARRAVAASFREYRMQQLPVIDLSAAPGAWRRGLAVSGGASGVSAR
jgi:23S rRNA U2552 (ribose-2'-O)-methylase RlmE/FtsJ